MSRSCDACPVIQAEERRAGIYNKVRSIQCGADNATLAAAADWIAGRGWQASHA